MSLERPVRVLVALGSNLGDRAGNLAGAVEALRSADEVRVLRVSPWIETQPEGGPRDQPPFLNGCLEAETTLAPEDLLWLLQRVETQYGRDRRREVRGGPRTLDLDLLFYGELEIERPGLVVPHPRLEERLFVLEPLCALDPDRRLARCGKTASEQLDELRRRAGVHSG